MSQRISVAEVLAMPELALGEPEVVAGAAGLARTLRWAHVVAGSGAIALLDGGELVLTTGAGFPRDPLALAALSRRLADADPAGVILELGGSFDAAPEALRSACEARAVPLIVLHREARFVHITQRIHQRILAAQTEALQARAEVHGMLTELGLNRSPVDYVIERLAHALDAPVVLEDSAHRVVAWASPTGDAETVLAPWARGEGRSAARPADCEEVAVEAQGKRWGRLTALPGPAHAAGRRTVLELGAFALALGRLADTEGEQWLELGARRLFDTVLSGRYRRDTELATQLAAAGLPVEGRLLLGATIRGVGDFGAHRSLQRAILETALRRAVSPEGRALLAPDPGEARTGADPALLALISFPRSDPRAASGTAAAPPLAERFARELEMLLPSTTPSAWRAHLSLGPAGTGIRRLVTSLERLRAAGPLDPVARAGRVTVQMTQRQPLAHLVRGLSGLPEVQEFAAEALGPVLAHDEEHGGDLIRVLEACTAHPGNRSLAAQRARLSRSVFYQRIALIEQLLGVDLSDGETVTTLAVALLAREPDGAATGAPTTRISDSRAPGRGVRAEAPGA